MALTARQRNALPPAAFIDRTHRRFPVPTQAQARKAGISESQRVRTLRSALSRAGQSQPRRQRRGGRTVTVRNVTPAIARRYVAARHAGTIASVRGTTRRGGRTAKGRARVRSRAAK